MKTTTFDYTTANGETVETKGALAELLASFKRQDRSERRKARRRKEISLEALSENISFEATALGVSVAEDYERSETSRSLETAVSELNNQQRKLVGLRYYQGLTDAEIASYFGVSRSAVTQQFGTIHKELKKFLKDFSD